MPFHKTPATGARYALIGFDAEGRECDNDRDGLMSDRILSEAKDSQATDIFLFSHGWMGDVDAAEDQYNRWIDAFDGHKANQARVQKVFSGFRAQYIGLHWPSLPWGNEQLNQSGNVSFSDDDALVVEDLSATFLDALAGTDAGDREKLRGHLEQLSAHSDDPDAVLQQIYEQLEIEAGPDTDNQGWEPVQRESSEGAVSFGDDFGHNTGPVQSIFGRVVDVLRNFSYFTMKKRARLIGEGGMHDFVRALQARTAPGTRIHLMGHSFGCVVVSSILRGRDGSGLPKPVDSVALVQGAMSLWSFTPKIPFFGCGAGYFEPVISAKAVSGPVITTQSKYDYAVGILYPTASVAGQQVSFGDEPPKYGAIGAWGIAGLAGITDSLKMLPSTGEYAFRPGRIYNLQASDFIKKRNGFSGAHSDIDGPEVANAVWWAAFTRPSSDS